MGTIRSATLNDAADIASLHVTTWREAFGGMPVEDAKRRLGGAGLVYWRGVLARSLNAASDETVLMAEAASVAPGLRPLFIGSKAVGFAWCGEARAKEDRTGRLGDGEIYMIYVLEAAQRQGHGRALLHACAQALVSRGFFTMGLWTPTDNRRARAFYEACGGLALGQRATISAGARLSLTGYYWEDPSTLFAPH